MAINPGQVFGSLNGIAGKDPAFGLEAVWIEPGQRDQAQSLGYTVVDASTVVATHLNQVLHKHAHERWAMKKCNSSCNCSRALAEAGGRAWCRG